MGMLCEQCHKEAASVYITRIVNDHKTEMYLCNQCAREKGELGGAVEPGFAFHNILAGLFDPQTASAAGHARQVTTRCSGCGLTLSDFRRIGKLGCSQCYSEFEKELEPLLKRIHRSGEHVGKSPHTARDERREWQRSLERLRTQLAEAVNKEEFEAAARLRDEMRALQSKLEDHPGSSPLT